MSTPIHWNAIYTRRASEYRVIRKLQKKKIIHYCPLNQVASNLNPKKIIVTPLFPSIIFVKVCKKMSLLQLTQLRNVINPVFWQKQPACFPDGEITLLEQFLHVHPTVQVTKSNLLIGSDVMPYSQASIRYIPEEKKYSLQLPSLGYCLDAVKDPVNSVRLIRKKSSRNGSAVSLAFIFGFENGQQK
jgi:hypothetical protein